MLAVTYIRFKSSPTNAKAMYGHWQESYVEKTPREEVSYVHTDGFIHMIQGRKEGPQMPRNWPLNLDRMSVPLVILL